MAKEYVTVASSTGVGAIALSTTIGDNFRLDSVTVHLSAAPITIENLTVTINAKDGSAYDTVLFKTNPQATAATDIVFIPDEQLSLENGDQIDLAYLNTDGATFGARIVTQGL